MAKIGEKLWKIYKKSPFKRHFEGGFKALNAGQVRENSLFWH